MTKKLEKHSLSLAIILLVIASYVLDSNNIFPGIFASVVLAVFYSGIAKEVSSDIHRESTISNLEIERSPLNRLHLAHGLPVCTLVVIVMYLDGRNALHAQTNQQSLIAVGIASTILISPFLGYFRRSQNLQHKVTARLKMTVEQIDSSTGPQFAFYFSQGDLDTPMHYLVWEKHLKSLGLPYMIILREKKHLNFFQKSDHRDVPTIFVASAKDLVHSLPSSVETIFYANNGFKNMEIINAHPTLRHVQLLHGDSDKAPSYNPVSRSYTDLFVSGQMAVDRYSNNGVFVQPERFKIVGRPQAEYIKIQEAREDKDTFTIAYMPTWMGYHEETRFSSLSIAPDIVRKILAHDFNGKKAHIIFKAHPLSHKDPNSVSYLDQVKQAFEVSNLNTGEMVCQTVDAIDVFNKSDVLISDISSVVIDFLYSKKPMIVSNMTDLQQKDEKLYPCITGSYLLNPDASNLIHLIEEAITTDALRTQRLELRDYAFGDAYMMPGELFRSTATGIINRNKK